MTWMSSVAFPRKAGGLSIKKKWKSLHVSSSSSSVLRLLPKIRFWIIISRQRCFNFKSISSFILCSTFKAALYLSSFSKLEKSTREAKEEDEEDDGGGAMRPLPTTTATTFRLTKHFKNNSGCSKSNGEGRSLRRFIWSASQEEVL